MLLFFMFVVNGYVYGVVWRFEARTCQTVIKFIRCNTLDISTIRQMHYTRCYRLVFIHFSLFLSICYYFSVCRAWGDRKSTRLNSSHVRISYAVFCLKKKKNKILYLK